MRGMAAIALGSALFACGCAAGQASPSAPEPVVVVVGATAQQKPTTTATEAKRPKQATRESARKAGILGALSGPQGKLQDAFGSGVGDALGGLTGTTSGDAFGLGGLGLSGSGSSPWSSSGNTPRGLAGRGGSGQGIGLGSLGTLGRGGTAGAGLGASSALRSPYPDTVQVNGNGLSIDAVQTVGQSHKRDIDECFRIERERSGVRGSITIACTVGPTGAVTQVAVADSTLPGVDLPYCIAQAVGSWTFPAPSTAAAVTVLMPFRF